MNWLGIPAGVGDGIALELLEDRVEVLETKTQNITSATPGVTNLTGTLNVDVLDVTSMDVDTLKINSHSTYTQLGAPIANPPFGCMHLLASNDTMFYKQDSAGNINALSTTPLFVDINPGDFPYTVSDLTLDNTLFRISPNNGGTDTITLPQSVFAQPKRLEFVRDFSNPSAQNSNVKILLDGGAQFDGRGYSEIFLGQGLASVTVTGYTPSIITKSPRMIASMSSSLATIPWASTNFPTWTAIPIGNFQTLFTDIFAINGSSITCKVKGIYQVTYNISFDSFAGGVTPYSVSARIFNATSGQPIANTTQTAGNFPDEDTAMSFYFPGLNLNPNDEIQIQVEHSNLIGQIISALLIMTCSL